jgi:hypothetical protein
VALVQSGIPVPFFGIFLAKTRIFLMVVPHWELAGTDMYTLVAGRVRYAQHQMAFLVVEGVGGTTGYASLHNAPELAQEGGAKPRRSSYE